MKFRTTVARIGFSAIALAFMGAVQASGPDVLRKTALPIAAPTTPERAGTSTEIQPCTKPTIYSITGTLGGTTGGGVEIIGCGFGDTQRPGRVLVRGKFDGKPNQVLSLIIPKKSSYNWYGSWQSNKIYAVLSVASFNTAPDQTVSVYVEDYKGLKSEEKSAQFISPRITKVFGSTSKLFDMVSIAPDATLAGYTTTVDQSSYGISVEHTLTSPTFTPTSPFTHTDKYRMQLDPGWVVKSVRLAVAESGIEPGHDPASTTKMTGPVPQVINLSQNRQVAVDVKWGVMGRYGFVKYRLLVEAEGPQ